MLLDTLKIKGNEAWVIRNTDIEKIQRIFLYVIPIVESVICVGIILNTESNWKYLSIIFCIFTFLLYKYYYLPAQEIGKYILQIQENQIIYVEPEMKYTIPIVAIEDVSDESVYFDFRGRGNSYWSHKIVIKIKHGYHIVRVFHNGEQVTLKSSNENPIIIEVTYVNLEHSDHNKLFEYISRIIKK